MSPDPHDPIGLLERAYSLIQAATHHAQPNIGTEWWIAVQSWDVHYHEWLRQTTAPDDMEGAGNE